MARGPAYGHLSSFAPGLSVGRHVARGTAIGSVGASGRVTGPHLHYEVLANGVPVDPQGMTTSSAPPEIRPAAIEADLRRALVLALVAFEIEPGNCGLINRNSCRPWIMFLASLANLSKRHVNISAMPTTVKRRDIRLHGR